MYNRDYRDYYRDRNRHRYYDDWWYYRNRDRRWYDLYQSQYSNVNQSIYNTGWMEDVYQNNWVTK